jgi:hypothetical protein
MNASRRGNCSNTASGLLLFLAGKSMQISRKPAVCCIGHQHVGPVLGPPRLSAPAAAEGRSMPGGGGRCIVAHGDALEQLEERLAAAGEDPQQVAREWVAGPADDSLLGGGELL